MYQVKARNCLRPSFPALPGVKIEDIKVEISLRCGQLIEIKRIDETLQRVHAEFSILARQDAAADAAEESEQRLWGVTGSA